jgi:hypothetical protein
MLAAESAAVAVGVFLGGEEGEVLLFGGALFVDWWVGCEGDKGKLT